MVRIRDMLLGEKEAVEGVVIAGGGGISRF